MEDQIEVKRISFSRVTGHTAVGTQELRTLHGLVYQQHVHTSLTHTMAATNSHNEIM